MFDPQQRHVLVWLSMLIQMYINTVMLSILPSGHICIIIDFYEHVKYDEFKLQVTRDLA